MGCTSSSVKILAEEKPSSLKSEFDKNVKRKSSGIMSSFSLAVGEATNRSAHTAMSPGHIRNENVQDEARSFRSKVSAIKMLARQKSSFDSFLRYLEEVGKSEYLICFCDIEEIKKLEEDQIVSRTYALVFRYKALYEEFKMNLGTSNNNGNATPSHASKQEKMFETNSARLLRLSYSTGATSSTATSSSKHLVWECLGKLKSLDYTSAPGDLLVKYLNICQHDLIARLVIPFESYLQSPFYRQWHEEQLELEKQRKEAQRKSISSHNSNYLISPRNSISAPLSPSSSISISGRPTHNESYANAYPDILIVDDSNITLKLTGKTLEQDGHHVEKATNGQIALQLMKSRSYDVVLIDCNMPVMDGFEAVRLFREHEKQHSPAGLLFIPSDVSSISDSQEDPRERAANKEKQKREATETSKTTPFTKTKPITDLDNTAETTEEVRGTVIMDLKSDHAEAKLESKLKRGMTAAHYHQLIIGMSTNIDEETRKKALEAGMDHFLPKPFTLQKFIDAIRVSREQKMLSRTQSKSKLPLIEPLETSAHLVKHSTRTETSAVTPPHHQLPNNN